jgi:hypothetical protein
MSTRFWTFLKAGIFEMWKRPTFFHLKEIMAMVMRIPIQTGEKSFLISRTILEANEGTTE